MENTIKTLLAQGKGQRAIARDLGISRKAVKRIKTQLASGESSKSYEREKQLDAHKVLIRDYLDAELTATLIHQKLKSKHGIEVSYSTVRRCVSEMRHQKVFVPLHSAPGGEGQVDFGYLGRFMLEDGSTIKVWVFCMVLSHSRYAYYEAVTDQTVATFIRCHIHAFEFFGGIPQTVLLDNLKAGVLRPDFYEPLLQEQYSEFLMHYGCAGRPCRVRKPEHKGLVVCGYVIVSNHIHLIAQTQGYDLSDVLRDFKKFTSKAIVKAVEDGAESRREWVLELFRYYGMRNSDNRKFQVWQLDNHPVALWGLPVIWQKLEYVHLNPVRAGWVAQPDHWRYSSAPNYMGGKGLLEVSTVEPTGPVLPLNW